MNGPETSVVETIRSVPAPAPIMSRARGHRLTERHREILDELAVLFRTGFADLTMSGLASELNCSLRTLYLLAEGRNDLVVTVLDRVLRDYGRAALAAVDPDMSAVDAIRAYLHAANSAVGEVPEKFARDMASIPVGVELNEAHSGYLIDVTRALLDLAVARGEIAAVDTSALARMLGGLGRDFSRPEVLGRLDTSPEKAANAMVDLVLDGLRT